MRSNLISPYHLTWVVQVDFKPKPSVHFLFLIVYLHPYEVPYHFPTHLTFGILLTLHSFPVQQTVVLVSQLLHPPPALKQTDTHIPYSSSVLPLLTACKSLYFSGAPCLNHDEAGRASSWDQLPCSQVSQQCHRLSCYARHTSLWGTWYWLSRRYQLSATELHLTTCVVTRLTATLRPCTNNWFLSLNLDCSTGDTRAGVRLDD